MNVIIIEDEKPAARRLQRMLAKMNIEPQVMLYSVSESIEWFSQHPHPDLVFLDIQLSDGLSFEIFEAVDVKSAIIFTTAYDEYALKAFKLNSVDYLLKPIDEEELEAAIAKFRENSGSSTKGFSMEDFRSLLNISEAPSYKKRFTVQVGQHLKIIETADICCFYSENKATYAHTELGRAYLLDLSLEALEKELNPEHFFRINRKSIVQLKFIKDIVAYTNSRLELKIKAFEESSLIVSRERVKDFKSWLAGNKIV
ncbi:MAG: LytTR family DNA-binding domain-containing protein [Salegentibacter sp.]